MVRARYKICLFCGQMYTWNPASPYHWRCPYCNGNILSGIRIRIQRGKERKQEKDE